MADIDLERRDRKGGVIWIVLGLILLALIVWWLWPDDDGVEDVAYIETPVQTIEPAAVSETGAMQGEGMTGDVLAAPQNHVGEALPSGEYRVAEVPTDRGFWIESNDNRLFVILVDEPEEQPVDIEAGQTIRIDGGTIRDSAYLSDLQGAELDGDTDRLAREQQAFAVVGESAITVAQTAQQ